MGKNIPSLITSLLVYFILLILIFLLFYKIIAEARLLLQNIPQTDLSFIIDPIKIKIQDMGKYFNDIDPAFVEKNLSQLSSVVTNSLNILGKSLNTLISIAMKIPVWIAILFIMVLSTYFFSRDMFLIKSSITSMLSDKGREKFFKVWYEGIKMLTRYVRAYFLIYSITFMETLVGFSILGIRYTVLLSIVASVADILPVLGVGIIYFPLAIIYYLSGNYFIAAGIVVWYLVVTIVRQVIEPKIVSNSLGIHPVATLSAIFIGLNAFGFAGMIYLMVMIVLYKVLRTTNIL